MTPSATGSPEVGPRERIERLWTRFVRRVAPGRARTTTPGEVAGRGVASGLPAGPVERLTDAFRAVEYSDTDPAAHVDDAERAATELDLTDEGRDDEAEDTADGGEAPSASTGKEGGDAA
jgi:hypothetical protein